MADPHIPPLTDFVLTDAETAAIQFALGKPKPWDHDSPELLGVKAILIGLKQKIRDFHLRRQRAKCCYCRMNLHGGGSFIVDREHIVPKDKYRDLTYVISNLSVACKRCNMQIKKADLAFLVDRKTIVQNHTVASQYKFIHPNYEKYSEFIKKLTYEVDDETYVKYTKIDHEKAHYTYNYFNLRELEVNTFDAGQGINMPSNENGIRERLYQELRGRE
jgi:uncharacterized protein (TIGR02646 family)